MSIDHATSSSRRYLLNPGYQLCYTLGILRFIDLFDRYGHDDVPEFVKFALGQGEINFDDLERILKQRWASIIKAREEKNIGVIIGLKSGQEKLSKAFEVKRKLDKSGRKTTLLALREITPEALMQFPNINAFINTACPCVAIYNTSNFLKPVLNVNEALVMLGEMNWEELCRGGWFTN